MCLPNTIRVLLCLGCLKTRGKIDQLIQCIEGFTCFGLHCFDLDGWLSDGFVWMVLVAFLWFDLIWMIWIGWQAWMARMDWIGMVGGWLTDDLDAGVLDSTVAKTSSDRGSRHPGWFWMYKKCNLDLQEQTRECCLPTAWRLCKKNYSVLHQAVFSILSTWKGACELEP